MFVVWLSYEAYHVDFDYIQYVLSREWSGNPVEQCIDLPEKYWIRIEKCWDYDVPQHGGVDRTDV